MGWGLRERYEKLKWRLLVAEALRLAKRVYSYRELSRITGIPESRLASYVTGRTVPSYEQAEKLWESLVRALDPRRVIVERLSSMGGLIDLSPVLTDPLLLKIVSITFYRMFSGAGITKILVPEASGISLATAVSMAFEAPMVIARRVKHNPYEEYYEVEIVTPPRDYVVYYVPKSGLSRGDKLLVVDDVVQTGRTLQAMEKLAEMAGARVVAAVALVAVGEEWRSRTKVPVEALVKLTKA